MSCLPFLQKGQLQLAEVLTLGRVAIVDPGSAMLLSFSVFTQKRDEQAAEKAAKQKFYDEERRKTVMRIKKFKAQVSELSFIADKTMSLNVHVYTV